MFGIRWKYNVIYIFGVENNGEVVVVVMVQGYRIIVCVCGWNCFVEGKWKKKSWILQDGQSFRELNS